MPERSLEAAPDRSLEGAVQRFPTDGPPAMQETWVGKIPWRREWQSIPGLLPGKSHGQRSLVGYSPGGCKELDTTERLHFTYIAVEL